MERNAKIGIALVVLGGLGVGVYFQAKKDAKLGTEAGKPDLPALVATDDVDKIDITNGSKGEVVIEKRGDKWEITKPLEVIANQQNVKSLLDNLKELKISDKAVTNADQETIKSYDLGADKGVHVVTFKGKDKKLDATFGKSGGLGDSVMIPGKPDIYLAKGYSGFMYTRELKDWRDREIFKFDDANAISLEIENKNGKFSFTKGDDKWAGTFKGAAIPHFDPQKVKTALGAFKNLTAEDFGDGKTPAETGLDAPEETVTIALKDNAGTFTLKVGKAAGTAHYAQKDGDSTIYTIGSFPYAWVTAEESKFEESADAGAKAGSAKPASSFKLPPMHPPLNHP